MHIEVHLRMAAAVTGLTLRVGTSAGPQVGVQLAPFTIWAADPVGTGDMQLRDLGGAAAGGSGAACVHHGVPEGPDALTLVFQVVVPTKLGSTDPSKVLLAVCAAIEPSAHKLHDALRDL